LDFDFGLPFILSFLPSRNDQRPPKKRDRLAQLIGLHCRSLADLMTIVPPTLEKGCEVAEMHGRAADKRPLTSREN
jgi:hypothetical protein